jgi:20S proteasome subunit beta 6
MSVNICPARVPAVGVELETGRPVHHASWSPYDDNGGTVLAIAGSNYCIVAGSTRMSSGYSILTREKTKLNQISPTCVVASAGFQADITTLLKRLKVR